MEELLESIANGQRKQCLEQLKESDYTFEDLLQELHEGGDYKEMITITKVAFSTGYITSDYE